MWVDYWGGGGKGYAPLPPYKIIVGACPPPPPSSYAYKLLNMGLVIWSDLSLIQYLRLTVCGELSCHSWSKLSWSELCFGPRCP